MPQNFAPVTSLLVPALEEQLAAAGFAPAGLADELSAAGFPADDAAASDAELDRQYEEFMMLEDARRELGDALVERHPGELAGVEIDGAGDACTCRIIDHDGRTFEGTGTSYAHAAGDAEARYNLRPIPQLRTITTPVYRLNLALWRSR